MSQKIIKVGTSLAITIPKKNIHSLRFKAGDSVDVRIDTKKQQLIVEKAKKNTDEIVDWTHTFIKHYKTALNSLSKK